MQSLEVRRLGRVLVSTPRQYWDRAAQALIRRRLDPIHLNSLVIRPLTDAHDVAVLEACVRGAVPPRVVFPSKSAMLGCIEGAFGSLEAFREWAGRDGMELLAMGADAEYLIDAVGVRRENVTKSSRPNTQAIVDDLETAGAKSDVLVFVPKVIQPLVEPPVVPDFLAGLRRIGCEPRAVPAYETRVGDDCRVELDLLFGGAIDAIAVSSQAEIQSLCLVAPGGRDRVVDAITSRGIVVAAHGETTAAGVRAGLPGVQVVVSDDPSTFDGMARAIERELKKTSG